MAVVGEEYVGGVEAFAFQVGIVQLFGVIISSFCFNKEILFETAGFRCLECEFLLYSALFVFLLIIGIYTSEFLCHPPAVRV
jgi:Na+/H+ antiporter NhaD/arsenite permease-like protein